MQFVERNVAKVKLYSTSATVVRNIVRKIAPCGRALSNFCNLSNFCFVKENLVHI